MSLPVFHPHLPDPRQEADVLDSIETTVGLFPGQGGYRKGILHEQWSAGNESVRAVFDTIDAAARETLRTGVTERIFTEDPPSPEDLFTHAPGVLQLSVFGVSVSLYRLLTARGAQPSVLVGHSLGEVAALVCAGAYTVRDAAELLCHRITAITRVSERGGMLSLSCDPVAGEKILDLIGASGLALAVDNGPRQIVLSGPLPALRKVETIAVTVGITAVRLLAPVAFHSPAMTAPRDELLQYASRYPQRPLHTPVYSPILGRFYRDADNLAEMLAQHLVIPVAFGPAIRRFHTAGARIFVEIGAGSALSGLVRAAFPDVTTPSVTTDLAGAAAYLRVPSQNQTPAVTAVPVPRQSTAPIASVNGHDQAASSAAPAVTVSPSRESVLTTIRTLYAEALEYPEEVLAEDAELEADLGVDSLKRAELLTIVLRHFELGPPAEDFRIAELRTVGSVAGLVHNSLATPSNV
jgi:[acyl-carrier-protein] S-malonyltransferase